MRVFHKLLLVAVFAVAGCAEERPKVVRSRPNVDATAMDNRMPEDSQAGETSAGPSGNVAPSAPLPSTGAAAPTGPTTAARHVMQGPVVFDLGGAKAALTGASFTAQLTVNAAVGAVPASITFRNMVIKSPDSIGMVLFRPLLVVQEGAQEKQYSIGADVNMKIPKGRIVPLGGVPAVNFEDISANAQIKIRFSALEAMAETTLSGIPNYRECKAPQNFQAVSNALKPCQDCHAGLFSYEFMDRDLATACGLNLKIIDASLNPSGRTPVIPAGAHKGLDTSIVRNALAAWKAFE